MAFKVGPSISSVEMYNVTSIGKTNNILHFIFILLIIIVFTISCSIPFLLGLRVDYGEYEGESAPIFHSVKSESFKLVVVGCLAISLPVALEYLLDINLLGVKSNLRKGFFERGLLIAVLLVSNVIILTHVIPSGDPAILNLIFNIHYIAIIIAAFSYLYRLGSPVFNSKTTIISGLSTGCGIICQQYYLFDILRPSFILSIVLYVSFIIGYFTLFYLAFKWYYHIRYMTQKDMNIDQYGSSVYVISLVIIYVGFLILSAASQQNYQKTSPQILSGRCYIDGSFTILIAILPGRMARQESIQAKVRLNLY